MKRILAIAALSMLTVNAFAAEANGLATLTRDGTRGAVVLISGKAAAKIWKDMTAVRAKNNEKVGEDIVCDAYNGGEKVCNILVSNVRTGDLGLGGGFSAGRNAVTGASVVNDYLSADGGAITVSGVVAESLWNMLDNSNIDPRGPENQKAAERYTCDKFRLNGKTQFRCSWSLESKSKGTIGKGSVG